MVEEGLNKPLKNKVWSTRDILVTCVISIIIGIVLIPLTYIFGWIGEAVTILAPLGYGIWILPGIMVPYIVKKPGAALFSQFIVGVVGMPFTAYGWTMIIFQVAIGLICELPFFLTRYKSYSLQALVLFGVFVSIPMHLIHYMVHHYENLSIEMQIVLFAITIISGGVIGGLFSKVLTDMLAKAGVLSGLLASRARVE